MTTPKLLSEYKYIQAKNFRSGLVNPSLIVIHCMEALETSKTAENVANWFGGPLTKNSCHFCVDNDSVVQCVPLDCRANHVGAPGNGLSVGVELAGYARQTEAEWLDAYGEAMLPMAAELVARLSGLLDVPVVRLDSEAVAAGARGICGHVDVAKGLGGSKHSDPGKGFPWSDFLGMVRSAKAFEVYGP